MEQKDGPSRKRKAGDDSGGISADNEAPRAVKIVEFISSRQQEIREMRRCVESAPVTSFVMSLPHHMRRRAASHNIKRLPRRLRDQAEITYFSGNSKPGKPKRPSRKHRRRPTNLLADYTRRQRNHIWLETHIWHAKRFHMTNLWGYRLPLHSNDKGVRATYRAAANYCLLQDVSYLCCVELSGSQEALLDGLARISAKETGPTFAAIVSIHGTREGSTLLYKCGQYPAGCLGPVQFMWKPQGDSDTRTLWVWVHPSSYNLVMQEIKQTFGIPVQEDILEPNQDKTVKQTSKVELTDKAERINKIKKKKDVQTDIYTNGSHSADKKEDRIQEKKITKDDIKDKINPVCYTNGKVVIRSLKDLLCRFRLTGPLSHTILQDTMKPITVTEDVNSGTKWWQTYYKGEKELELLQQQETWSAIKGLHTPALLPSRSILSLTVKDPRSYLPRVKTKVAVDVEDELVTLPDICREWPANVSDSPIWDDKIRQEVKQSKLTEHELNKQREKNLVPGTALNLGEDESHIPVVLIQTPGSNHSSAGWSAGWDVILPSGWAMPFWVGLVYRGARAAALRESVATAAEAQLLHFPEDFPDTPAGKEMDLEKQKELQQKYDRYPPAKRPNYEKLCVSNPFMCPWQSLISEWHKGTREFVVLRNFCRLKDLASLCSFIHGSVNVCQMQQYGEERHTLVAVHVNMVQRGVPEAFAMICVPSEDDLIKFKLDRSFGGPIEPLHKTSGKKDSSSDISNDCESVLPTRHIAGYLHHAGFALSKGHGAAKGFVALFALRTLLSLKYDKTTYVLVRSPNSQQYRFARLSVMHSQH